MKHFKIFLIQRGVSKTVTEKALQEMEADNLADGKNRWEGKYKIVGECDEAGNLLENIADGNFTNFKPEEKQKRKYERKQHPVSPVVGSNQKDDDGEPLGNIDAKTDTEKLERRERNNALHKESLKNKTDGKQKHGYA